MWLETDFLQYVNALIWLKLCSCFTSHALNKNFLLLFPPLLFALWTSIIHPPPSISSFCLPPLLSMASSTSRISTFQMFSSSSFWFFLYSNTLPHKDPSKAESTWVSCGQYPRQWCRSRSASRSRRGWVCCAGSWFEVYWPGRQTEGLDIWRRLGMKNHSHSLNLRGRDISSHSHLTHDGGNHQSRCDVRGLD